VSAFLNAANAPFRPHPSRSSWPDHSAGPRSPWRSPHRGSGRVQHLFQRGHTAFVPREAQTQRSWQLNVV